ncbi:amino acid adenylation domain-containing protein [Microcoleus sp. T3_A4]|uniref:amino acid adenylation domain-containing protein n=1 Tax=Microcoleus sp. T3_A4 TaxID=2818968 RepID=UPI002FD4E175
MNTIEFINNLRKLDINLFMEGDRLRCNAPEGTLTPALKSEINGRKAEIISFLHQANNQKNASTIAPISRTENNTFPLSFAQQRLWFLNQLQANSAFYNIPVGLHFSGQLNIVALESSLQLLINRHEILRTNFIAVDGEPVQAIAATRDFTLPVVDFRPLPASEREIEYEKLASQSVMYVFNLAQEPLLRAQLVQLTPTENVLLLTVHHIIFDGWSVNIFVQELTTIYSALVEHHAPTLPKIHLQYVDFAVWQQQWLQGEVLESQLAYWQQKLAGMPALLELPADRPRPAVQSFRGETQVFTLEQDISEALVSLSQQQGVTLFMLLLTAFKILLYRYTNQPDIVVGSSVANRQYPQIQGMIGFFVNNLVLRTDLSENPTFVQLLPQVRQVVLEAYDHQNLPFDKLVESLHPERHLSYSPLFQISFDMEHESTSDITLQDLKVNISEPGSNDTAKFDLSLSLQKTKQGLTGAFEYSTDLFDTTTIARMIENWQTLLAGIVANPEQRLSDLPILTAIEQHKLLVEWNQTQQGYPQNLCIHQLFEAQVEQTPDAVAVIFKEEYLTYRELNAKANQLAHHLQALGVKPETLVAICVERSLEMIVGLLGILKAGGAYVPLDAAYPSERLAFMLEDSAVPVLLTQQRLVDRLAQHEVQVVCLDTQWEAIAQHSEENTACGVNAENLAYVIYTSGSTGKPKGVTIQHRSLVNYTTAVNIEYEIEKYDRILQFSSISFDVSAEEIYTSLSSGATLVLRTDSMLDSIEGFLQKCKNWEITVMALPTAYWHELTAFLTQETVVLPPSLRLIIIGGEKALPERLKTWLECVEQRVRLVNNYGPTEATVGATIYDLSAANATFRELPIGRPLGNVQTYILDGNGQPVPIGVPAELHIGGAGLARGYLNRPDLTAQRFIPNPFSDFPTSRLYKTGDLVRYLNDGNIEYLGRIDDQVKIRGFRIELGEIEAVLAKHPNVRSVTVIDREDAPGNKRLVAYLVSNLIPERVPYHSECQVELDGNAITIHTQDISTGGVGLVGVPAIERGESVRVHMQLPGESEPRWLSGTVVWSRPPQAGIRFHLTPSEQAQIEQSVDYQLDTQDLWKTLQRTVTRNLRHYLKQKLPDYMIPSAFVLMKALPLTPNGKIDRRALPAPDNFHNEQEDKFVAPDTPTETKLAAIWVQVLGLEKVGINDNFFELGGHSLQAVSLVSKLSAEMNLKVSVKLLFEHPTIAKLAKAIEPLFTTEPSVNPQELQTEVEKPMTASLPKITDSSPFFKLEQRSLLSLLAVGKIAPVDSAALGYLPLSLLKETKLTRDEVLQKWFENLPMWDAVMETKWGRIAGLILPIFEDELYSDQQTLVQMVVEALEMAGRIGAKTVSLTGLIPSATDYGRAIAKAIEGRNNLPKITTGHATTCSSVVLTIKKILQISNRYLQGEKVAFIGLGSIGINTLRLMLKCLPHPQSIIVCDIYSKLESLQNLQGELSGELGFRGSVQIATSSSSSELPPEIYDATLIIGATNVPDILDIDRLKPGTLIVDDSGPHCFSPEQAIERFEKHKDILFTEGGALHAPDPIETVIYLPESMKKNMDEDSLSDEFKPTNPLNIMGCVMSSLLSSRFDNIQPTVGLPNLETCVQHYQGLERLGFQAADLHCEGYVLHLEPNQPSA